MFVSGHQFGVILAAILSAVLSSDVWLESLCFCWCSTQLFFAFMLEKKFKGITGQWLAVTKEK